MAHPRLKLFIVSASSLLFIALLAGVAWWITAEEPPLYEQEPQGALRVLFVGNSHVFHNDVPSLVQRIAHHDEATPSLWAQSHVRGGASLSDQAADPTLRAALREQDAIIFQGGSLEPIETPDSFAAAFKELYGAARTQGDTKVILFDSWARAARCPSYRMPSIPDTPDLSLRAIEHGVSLALRDTTATHAPTARAFDHHIRAAAPVMLHTEDHNHATLEGSYLAALVLYASIVGEVPEDPWYPTSITGEAAAHLVSAARAVTSTPNGG